MVSYLRQTILRLNNVMEKFLALLLGAVQPSPTKKFLIKRIRIHSELLHLAWTGRDNVVNFQHFHPLQNALQTSCVILAHRADAVKPTSRPEKTIIITWARQVVGPFMALLDEI